MFHVILYCIASSGPVLFSYPLVLYFVHACYLPPPLPPSLPPSTQPVQPDAGCGANAGPLDVQLPGQRSGELWGVGEGGGTFGRHAWEGADPRRGDVLCSRQRMRKVGAGEKPFPL